MEKNIIHINGKQLHNLIKECVINALKEDLSDQQQNNSNENEEEINAMEEKGYSFLGTLTPDQLKQGILDKTISIGSETMPDIYFMQMFGKTFLLSDKTGNTYKLGVIKNDNKNFKAITESIKKTILKEASPNEQLTNAWYQAKDIMGAEEMLDALYYSLNEEEIERNLEYINRMYELNLFNDNDDTVTAKDTEL